VHQVGLAEADAAIEEQRIEPWAGRPFGHTTSAGIGEFVRLADDEAFKRKARVERRGQFWSRVDTIF
jgi:hypothetical protein